MLVQSQVSHCSSIGINHIMYCFYFIEPVPQHRVILSKIKYFDNNVKIHYKPNQTSWLLAEEILPCKMISWSWTGRSTTSLPKQLWQSFCRYHLESGTKMLAAYKSCKLRGGAYIDWPPESASLYHLVSDTKKDSTDQAFQNIDFKNWLFTRSLTSHPSTGAIARR